MINLKLQLLFFLSFLPCCTESSTVKCHLGTMKTSRNVTCKEDELCFSLWRNYGNTWRFKRAGCTKPNTMCDSKLCKPIAWSHFKDKMLFKSYGHPNDFFCCCSSDFCNQGKELSATLLGGNVERRVKRFSSQNWNYDDVILDNKTQSIYMPPIFEKKGNDYHWYDFFKKTSRLTFTFLLVCTMVTLIVSVLVKLKVKSSVHLDIEKGINYAETKILIQDDILEGENVSLVVPTKGDTEGMKILCNENTSELLIETSKRIAKAINRSKIVLLTVNIPSSIIRKVLTRFGKYGYPRNEGLKIVRLEREFVSYSVKYNCKTNSVQFLMEEQSSALNTYNGPLENKLNAESNGNEGFGEIGSSPDVIEFSTLKSEEMGQNAKPPQCLLVCINPELQETGIEFQVKMPIYMKQKNVSNVTSSEILTSPTQEVPKLDLSEVEDRLNRNVELKHEHESKSDLQNSDSDTMDEIPLEIMDELPLEIKLNEESEHIDNNSGLALRWPKAVLQRMIADAMSDSAKPKTIFALGSGRAFIMGIPASWKVRVILCSIEENRIPGDPIIRLNGSTEIRAIATVILYMDPRVLEVTLPAGAFEIIHDTEDFVVIFVGILQEMMVGTFDFEKFTVVIREAPNSNAADIDFEGMESGRPNYYQI